VGSDKGFFASGKSLLAFGFLAVFMGNFGQSFYIGSYGASIQQDLQLSASAYGLIYSIATLLAGTSLMVVGGFIDRLPLFRFTALVAVGLWCASMLFVFAENLAVLIAALFLVRLCGQGLLPHTGITTMARCFDANRGKAISIAVAGVPVGEVILPLVATTAIAVMGWQKSWLLVSGFIPMIFLPLSYLLLRSAERSGYPIAPVKVVNVQTDNTRGRRQVLTDPRFWRVLPALIASPFVVTGVFIHQAFFIEQKAWSLELFAAGFVVYGLVHGFASVASGWLIDRFSAVRLLPFYNVPLLLAMATVAFVSGGSSVLIMLGLIGLSIGCSGPVGGALWAEVYGTERLGSIRSMVSSFGVWSTSLSPVIFGVLIDQGVSYQLLSYGLIAFVGAACVFAAFSYSVNASPDDKMSAR